MKSKKEQMDRIERALLMAYGRQADHEFAPDWRQKVMRDIRRLHGQTRNGNLTLTEALAFRRIILPFASATAFAAIALLFFMFNGVLDLDYDVLGFLMEDSTGLFSQQLLDLFMTG